MTEESSVSDTRGLIDIWLKSTVVVAALVYGCGFIVVSIHHYSYGLAEANPLRPKVLAAGVWCLAFAVVPFALFLRPVRIAPKWVIDRGESRLSRFWYSTAAASVTLGLILHSLFQQTAPFTWSSTGAIWALLVIGGVVHAIEWYRPLPDWIPRTVSAIFVATICYYGILDLNAGRQGSVASIALWFLGFAWAAGQEIISRDGKLRPGNWLQTVALAGVAVASFGRGYYPRMMPSWGGGAPIPATVYFSKDSTLLPGRSAPVEILDESDTGIYVVGGSNTHAAFIPRSEISMVYYSSESSELFLTNIK